MSEHKFSVLISGASIAGLNTAYWLAQNGFIVTIVERASHIRPGGQALDLRGPSLEVAARMGILEELRNNSTKLRGMSVMDAATGKEIFSSTERSITGGKFDSADIEILRDDLCRLLFQKVDKLAEYIFNDTITSISQDESGVDVTFSKAAPRRFDLVIGADGIRSNVRRLVFGDDDKFLRYLGHYVSIFTMPNFLDLDHWELFIQHNGEMVTAIIAKGRENEARTYLGFRSDRPIDYDYHNISEQKQLVADHNTNVGWKMSEILRYMWASPNFYFDGMYQVIMGQWSKGRVVLVGDAGYSVSVSLGQGTTIATVAAYVLAGELSVHKNDLKLALNNYENELREYVETNQQLAYNSDTDQQQGSGMSFADTDNMEFDIPDFGLSVIPFTIKDYWHYNSAK